MKFKISVLVTRPALPVPGTSLMLMPSFFARCLTAGVERALAEEFLEELLPGGEWVALSTTLVACWTASTGVSAAYTS